jgi:hypothetical protein
MGTAKSPESAGSRLHVPLAREISLCLSLSRERERDLNSRLSLERECSVEMWRRLIRPSDLHRCPIRYPRIRIRTLHAYCKILRGNALSLSLSRVLSECKGTWETRCTLRTYNTADALSAPPSEREGGESGACCDARE